MTALRALLLCTGVLILTPADSAGQQPPSPVAKPPVPATAPPCTPASVIIDVGSPVQWPSGIETAGMRIAVATEAEQDIGVPQVIWTSEKVDLLRSAARGGQGTLVWLSADPAQRCSQRFALAESLGTAPAPQTSRQGYNEDECGRAGEDWRRDLAPFGDASGRTLLVFHERGSLCYQYPMRPRMGDAIYVGVFTDDESSWSLTRVDFEPCAASAGNAVATRSERLAEVTSGLQSRVWFILSAPAIRCWNRDITINIRGDRQRSVSYAFTQTNSWNIEFVVVLLTALLALAVLVPLLWWWFRRPKKRPVRVFLSYRRSDQSGLVDRLYERLAAHFGAEHVFRDVSSLAAGTDFPAAIRRRIGRTEVMLAAIGPTWSSGLADLRDWVRMELEIALLLGVRIIPILLPGGSLPRRTDLPESLQSIADLQALSLRFDPDFSGDVARIIDGITTSGDSEGES